MVLPGCGDDASSDSGDSTAGTYRAEVVTAEFPRRQRLAETTLMRLGVRNEGEKTIPSLTITVSVGGEEGRTSSLPFAIRSPEPGLAQPDRPVWVLAEGYPRLAGAVESAGAENARKKTYDFGPLEPGRTVEAVWKLTASRTGFYRVLYGVGADLSGDAKAETAAGTQPKGAFGARITRVPPDTIVTDNGDVVIVPKEPRRPAR